MKVWVTGAQGLLGRALAARLAAAGIEHVLSGREVDVTDASAVLGFARRERPQLILHSAAYTRVDDAEADVEAASAVNADGPAHVGRAARAIGASVVHFSTDYVFDGRADVPYAEDAAPGPLNVYGRTKLAGEERLRETLAAEEAERRVHVVRSSWLFGERGRSFVTTMLGLMQQRQRLEVVSDQRASPTYASDLARAALRLSGVEGAAAAPSGTYHFANAGVTSWHGFAEEILRQARSLGLPLVTEQIAAVDSAESGRPARRPAYSALGTARITPFLGAPPRHWGEALGECLAKVREAGP
jgi:dTDP-4-dehydrorhamnose reductase